MKKIKIIFFLFLSFPCLSQNTIFKGIVQYNQMESISLGKNGKAERLSTLIFNKNTSSYTTEKDSLDNISLNKDMHASVTVNKDENGGRVNLGGLIGSREGKQVYTDIIKDSVWSSSRAGSYYYTAESKTKINWLLLNETKKISSFECKSATCTFRGRKYLAWYAPDLPLPFGPWKLQGLPGLILEAYDENEEIYYHFKSVEFPTQNATPIEKVKLVPNNKNLNPKWLTIKETLKVHNDFLNWCYESIIINLPGQLVRKDELHHRYKEIIE
jgi:GLPGLI family protein